MPRLKQIIASISNFIFKMFKNSQTRKIDFEKLDNADFIAYKSLKSNRIIARCTIGALLISIFTLFYTRMDIENSNNTMTRILNLADTTARAAKKSAEFSEKSSIIAERALMQSDKQFINLNRSALIYHSSSMENEGINVYLSILGKKDIKINKIDYSIQFLPRESAFKFNNNAQLNSLYNTNVPTVDYNDLDKLEGGGITFKFYNYPPTEKLLWNNVDSVYLLNSKIEYVNLITNKKCIYKLAILCEYSSKLGNQCELILEK